MNSVLAYLKSFQYAIEGLIYAFKEHSSFKIEVIAAVMVMIAGLFFKVSRGEWLILILLIFSVLVAELLNTAVETALDYLAKEHHVDVKIAKDVAAGAVFLLSLGSVAIGLVIFLPYILS